MFSANSSQVSEDRLYVEDVFSTYLYAGTGSTQTITNGIDLAGKGGLVWLKARNSAQNNFLFDTNRGVQKRLVSNSTAEEFQLTDGLSAFNSNGFTLGSGYTANGSGLDLSSWTFREAPKFFDVVTYTGNGSTQNIAHSLGVAPGCIIVKKTSTIKNWVVYHSSQPSGYLYLNTTDATQTAVAQNVFGNTSTVVAPTSTVFTVGSNDIVNGSGETYVAYLFAHDTTSDGIIQCGSFTTDSGGSVSVNLGWEPQWVLYKTSATTSNWRMIDNMRGFPASTTVPFLSANLTNAEATASLLSPTATGFTTSEVGSLPASTAYIYIAIRRGPMRTPTSGTSVFSPQAVTLSTGSNTIVSSDTAGPMDVVINQQRSASGGGGITQSRLTGGNYLITSSTGAETSGSYTNWDRMTGTKPTPWTDGQPVAAWQFRRAPGFFDVVCYTGTGSTTIPHNLGVAPEMMIVKSRSAINDWYVYSASIGATKALRLNVNGTPLTTSAWWNNTAPTSTVFTVGSDAGISGVGTTFVAYLFASCPGVSKCGSYTGNGSSQTINCGFAAGARFVMIKRTDSTGNWLVADSARGIVAGNDPLLYLNSTAAEVTTLDWIDADASGFIVNQDATANANVNGATYIYLAIS